jgi:outer membrane protein TolC
MNCCSIVGLAILLAAGPAQAATKLSLSDAIALAERHRSEVAQAEIDIRLAELNTLRAWLERAHLSLNGQLMEQYEKINANAPQQLCMQLPEACIPGSEQHIINLNASLTVPLWSGLTVENDLSRAHALERSASAHKRATLRMLVVEVASTYWAVRRMEFLRDLSAKQLKRNEEISQLTKSRVDAGIAASVDFNRTETLVLRQESDIVRFESSLAQARAQLAAVLQVDDDLELTEELKNEEAVPGLEIVLEDAKKLRPELTALDAQLDAARAQVGSLQGAYWPQVSLFAQANAQNQALGIPQSTLLGNFSGGVMVSWLVFDTFTTLNAVKEAELALDRLAQDRVRARYIVEADVRSAHARLQKAVERREPTKKAMSIALASLEIMKKRYKAGTALLLEVLDSQNEMLRTESDSIENGVEIAEASAALQAARGIE